MTPSEHPSPERLAAMAAGDEDDRWAARHAARCQSCALELAELLEIVELLHDVDPDELAPPPDHVWRRVEAATASKPDPGDARERGAETVVSLHAVPDQPPGPPSRAAGHLLSRRTAAVAAAALVVGVGAGLGVGVGALRDPSVPDRPVAQAPASREVSGVVVARAVLDPTSVGGDPGAAQLLRTSEGYRLWVELSAPSADAEVREVWLLDDQDRLLSLGLLGSGDAGAFGVPEAALDSFDVVDISAEPLDGDPAHSGVTLFRGRLAPG